MEGPVILSKSPQYFTLTNVSYRGEVYNKLQNFPDTNTFRNGVFYFKNSFSNIEYCLDNFENINWIGETKDFVQKFKDFKINEAHISLLKVDCLATDAKLYGDLNSKTKPFDHQLRCFNISKEAYEYGIFFEQGCGKTKVVIDTARYLFDREKIQALVVIAPNGVHDNWIDEELPIHLAGDYVGVAWRSNFKKDQKAVWENAKTSKDLKIFTFNVEGFASDKTKKELVSIMKLFRCMIAIDESQKIKNPSAKRTKFLTSVSMDAGYRRILTGTPITKGSEDFYSQLAFLNPNILGITSFFAFKRRYCVMGGWENKMVVGYRNVEELQSKVENYSMRVLKKDCLDLPPKIYRFANFDLTKVQLDMIKQIKEEGIADLQNFKSDEKELIMEYAISRMTKIQQISNGYIYDTENQKTIEIVPPNKNPRLLKLMEELKEIEGEKCIIWCQYKEDINIITKALPRGSFVTYDGSVDQDQRKENRRLFKEDKTILYFVVNIQTGATGLTLTIAHNTKYFSNSYDLELRLQSEDRNHRIGTKHSVVYTDLIANKTFDKKIITALKKKKSVSDLILKDPIGFFLEGN